MKAEQLEKLLQITSDLNYRFSPDEAGGEGKYLNGFSYEEYQIKVFQAVARICGCQDSFSGKDIREFYNSFFSEFKKLTGIIVDYHYLNYEMTDETDYEKNDDLEKCKKTALEDLDSQVCLADASFQLLKESLLEDAPVFPFIVEDGEEFFSFLSYGMIMTIAVPEEVLSVFPEQYFVDYNIAEMASYLGASDVETANGKYREFLYVGYYDDSGWQPDMSSVEQFNLSFFALLLLAAIKRITHENQSSLS